VGYSSRFAGSLIYWDQGSWCSRTSLLSDGEASPSSSLLLPTSGMMLSGAVFPLEMSEAHRGASGGGSWPTPTAGDSKGSGSRNTETSRAHAGTSLTDAILGDGGQGRKKIAARLSPDWVERLQGFPIGWTRIDGQPLRESSTRGSRPGREGESLETLPDSERSETPSCPSAAPSSGSGSSE